MKKMTKIEALNIALTTIENDEARSVIENMITQLSKPRTTSDEAKARMNEKRKQATAEARAALMDEVLPVLREVLSHTQQGLTAKEIYSDAEERLPEDFTANKVQYILLHELADEVEKIETKGKANVYRLK